jgi:hypothetical protein
LPKRLANAARQKPSRVVGDLKGALDLFELMPFSDEQALSR